MATYADLSLTTRLFLKAYPFHRYTIAPLPCTPLRVPLAQARVALVTSGGMRTPKQADFDFSNKKGDTSYREIPNDIAVNTLVESHRSNSFDHSGIEADANLAFPLDRMRELLAQGVIGALNHRHFSFMGSIVGPAKLIHETAPQVAEKLRADGVQVALLTPV